MNDQRVNKKKVYSQIFEYIIINQQNGKKVIARDIIENQMKQNKQLNVLYDKDLTDILLTYIASKEIKDIEQQLVNLINTLMDENLVLEQDISEIKNNLEQVCQLRKLANSSAQDTPYLINQLKRIFNGTDSLDETIERFEQSINDIIKLNVDQYLIITLADIQERVVNYNNQSKQLRSQYDNVNLFSNNSNNLQPNLSAMEMLQNLLVEEKEDLETVLNAVYEKERISDHNYSILMQEEFPLIQKIIKEMDLKRVLGLEDVFVQPYGSIVSGFCQNTSDIDISINTNCYLDERLFLTFIFSFIKNYFELHSIQFKSLELIESARIPLIKLVKVNSRLEASDKSVSIDICVNNILGCTNSQMLRVLSEVHPLIMKLGIVIKKWAKNKEIISKKNLTSYSFMLIMINFLQKKQFIDNSFIQRMQRRQREQDYETKIKRTKDLKEDFITNIYYVKTASLLKKDLIKYKETNPKKKTIIDCNLSTLFREFIEYYSDTTDEKRRYINTTSDYVLQHYDTTLYFFIEDPFDKKHNPGERSKVENIEKNIYFYAFKNALNDLNNQEYHLLFDKPYFRK